MLSNLKNNKVSVIIPVYNRNYVVERAIRSVLSQTFPAFELIVVDDGSDALYAQFINDLQKKYQFRLIRLKNNQGVSVARNTGIKAAQGAFIAFLDSDDEWMLDKLELQINYFRENAFASVLYTDEQWIRNGKKVNAPKSYNRYSGVVFFEIVKKCFIGTSTFICKKNVFNKIGMFSPELLAAEDYDLWIRISLFYPFHLIRKKLINKYAGHGDQLSFSTTAIDYYRLRSLYLIARNQMLTNREKKVILTQMSETLDKIYSGFKKRNKIEKFNEMRSWYDEIKADIHK